MTVSPHDSPSSAVLRLNADVGVEHVSAFISHSALSARYGSFDDLTGMRAMISEHRSEIDAAVARRIQAGARQPVVLRASDLCWPQIVGATPECCSG